MDFTLSKLLPLLVYPVGVSCWLLIVALAIRGRPRVQRMLTAAALVNLLFFSNQWVAELMAVQFERQYIPQAHYPNVDAIVLLGGGTRAKLPPRPISELNEAGERVAYAAHLYHLGKAPVVIVSGGAIDLFGSTVAEAEAMHEYLTAFGVPDEAIVQEDQSRNTYENAIYVRDILDELGAERVLLVTSALHMPRAVAIFVKQGMDVIPAPVDYMVTGAEEGRTIGRRWDGQFLKFLPSAEYLELSTRVLREVIGLVAYRLRGWL